MTVQSNYGVIWPTHDVRPEDLPLGPLNCSGFGAASDSLPEATTEAEEMKTDMYKYQHLSTSLKSSRSGLSLHAM
jgi:hypothetical protein